MDQLVGLRVFCRVVERGSFSAVARELGLSQPTVSRHVAGLEGRVGARLLVRTTRKVRPTEQGRALYERVSRALGELLEAEIEVASGEGALAGQVRVAAPGAFGKRFVLPVVTDYLAQYPKVRVELLLSDIPIDLVQAGVDLAIRIGAPGFGTFVQRKLGALAQVMVATPAYLRARGRPRTLDELAGHAVVFHADSRQNLLDMQARGLLPALPPFEVRLLSDDIEAVRSAALAGLGLAPLSAWLVAEELAAGRLIRVLPEVQVPPAHVVGVFPPGRLLPARVAVLLDRIQANISREIARSEALLAESSAA